MEESENLWDTPVFFDTLAFVLGNAYRYLPRWNGQKRVQYLQVLWYLNPWMICDALTLRVLSEDHRHVSKKLRKARGTESDKSWN